MTFLIKQKISGEAGENLGKFSTLSGYFSAASVSNGGVDNSKIKFYKLNEDGEWEEHHEKDIGVELKSLSSFRDYCVYGVSENIYVTKFSDLSFETNIGKVGNNSFGMSSSVCEKFLAVGAPAENDKGVVYIYKNINGVFNNESEETISTDIPDVGQFFGSSVSISNNFLVIGANGDRNQRGAVYVYEHNYESGIWDLHSKIYSSDGKIGDKFGYKVSLCGDYFASSSPFFDANSESDVGAVYIYKYFNDYWHEVDKKIFFGAVTGGEHFGSSLVLDNDYLAVGSSGAKSGQGEIDIFYKKRSWGHIYKIADEHGAQNDSFGESFDIDNKYIIVGAPNKNSNSGEIFFFEDPPSRFRAAQEFCAKKVFIPSKISAKLDIIGKSSFDCWTLSNNYYTSIDSTNFSKISKKDHKIVFSDEVIGFTGKGYMSVLRHPEVPDYSSYGISGLDDIIHIKDPSDFSILEYPIVSNKDNSYYLWIRGCSFESNLFQIDILIDGEVVNEINEEIESNQMNSWEWYNVKIIIPDTKKHILGLRMKQFGNAIDKIYLDTLYDVPYLYGHSFSISPYITCHFQIYDKVHDNPFSPLHIYDYKTTINEMVDSDWYNFNSKIIVPTLSESSMHFSERTYEDIGKENSLGKSFADNLWSCSNFETHAQFYDMVKLLKDRNPGILMPLSTSSCVGIGDGEQDSKLFKYYIEESEVREEWWLKDSDGHKIPYDSSGVKWYLDIRSFDVRYALIKHNFNQAKEYGFNVMQFDNLLFNLSYSLLFNFNISYNEWTKMCLKFSEESRNYAINNGMLSYIHVDVDDINDIPEMIDAFSFYCDGILNNRGFNDYSSESLKEEYDSYEKALIKGKKIFIRFEGGKENDVYEWLRPLSINYQNIFAFPSNNNNNVDAPTISLTNVLSLIPPFNLLDSESIDVDDYDNEIFRTEVLRKSVFEDFYDSYYIVLSTTGETESHFLIWENGNINDKGFLSAFKF